MPKTESVLAALGQNIRQTRETKQLTQEKLAEFSGLDPTYISGIERGLRNSGIKNVARIAKALGLTTAELCTVSSGEMGWVVGGDIADNLPGAAALVNFTTTALDAGSCAFPWMARAG